MNDFMDTEEQASRESYEQNIAIIAEKMQELAVSLKAISDSLQSVINSYTKSIKINNVTRK